MEEAQTAQELYNMGKNYLSIRNYEKAEEYLTKAVVKGSGKAGRDLMWLGQYYLEQKDAEALACFRTLANHGSVEANLLLGEIYRDGQIVRTSIDLAFGSFCEAYRLGSGRGAYEAGMLIWRDVYRDDVARECAKEWFQAAVDDGYNPAYTQMGLLFSDGRPTNLKEAYEWFRKGMEKGNTDCMVYLAGMHVTGHGTSKDIKKGISLMERAAKEGSVKANTILGELYANGVFVSRNAKKASEYNEEAERLRNEQENSAD